MSKKYTPYEPKRCWVGENHKIIYDTIVNKLVKLREAHHIGTNDMADYVGVTRQSIYNFENGNNVSYNTFYEYVKRGFLTYIFG